MKTFLNCAIYTRKSSEEGLEQEFNSLDAQREACEAYIASQKHEGWKALPDKYDDGGFSGGNMDRPGLKRLLADIDAGKVKIVVVYKVDRLTRALSDFAKIVEQFDKKGISFVSVTQQFNTTSSMGRLTLNVLLSFAQFEREVTSERIRDKISASKKKGMWMGGYPPLGYDVIDKKLIINKEETKIIRLIYETYLRLGNVRLLKEELDRLKLGTKRSLNQKGQYRGGARFSRGGLYKLLANPLFKGMIFHKGKIYTGEHESAVSEALWQQVQEKLQANMFGHKSGRRTKSPCLLTGLIYDSGGNRFSPARTHKKGKPYRYYVSQALLQYRSDQKPQVGRIPADEIEWIVRQEITNFLSDRKNISKTLGADSLDVRQVESLFHQAKLLSDKIEKSNLSENHDLLRTIIKRITVKADEVIIEVKRDAVVTLLGNKSGSGQASILLNTKVRLLRCGIEKRLVVPGDLEDADAIKKMMGIKKAVINGFHWREQFFNGTYATIEDLARTNNVHATHVGKMIELSFLPPKQIEQIFVDKLPAGITIQQLVQLLPT